MTEKQTILIADDEPEIRDVLRMMLSGEGYEIIEACNAREAENMYCESYIKKAKGAYS